MTLNGVNYHKCARSYLSAQFSHSVMSNSATPWTVAHPDSLFFTISQSLLKLMSIDPGMPSNHLSLCHPLFLPSIFPRIRVFSNESALCLRCPKNWSFSCSISPSNEYSGLISFSIDQFDLLAVQGTLKNLLQHHNSKTLILQHSAFFMIQLSHPYTTTGKNIALTFVITQFGPLSENRCFCFLIWCLGLSQLFFQGASIF